MAVLANFPREDFEWEILHVKTSGTNDEMHDWASRMEMDEIANHGGTLKDEEKRKGSPTVRISHSQREMPMGKAETSEEDGKAVPRF